MLATKSTFLGETGQILLQSSVTGSPVSSDMGAAQLIAATSSDQTLPDELVPGEIAFGAAFVPLHRPQVSSHLLVL